MFLSMLFLILIWGFSTILVTPAKTASRLPHSTQLHPTPPNASPALVESPALPAGEAAAAGTKSILGLRDSAAACEPAPALWAPILGWQHGAGTWPNIGLARSRRTDHAPTTQPTQGECRTGANCFFLEVARGRCRSVRLAQ